MKPGSFGRWPVLAVLVVLLAGAGGLAGCGSKTGLEVPDATVVPLERDGAPLDVAVDARDAASPPLCIEAPLTGEPVQASLSLPVSLVVVDLLLMLDATGSMADEIDNVRTGLRRHVLPGVQEAIPDAAFGVALVGEFPELPHGPADVRPYELRTPITRDVLQVEAALERVPDWGNFDEPEAQVEALYQAVTGEGLGSWIDPSAGCPAGGLGAACFRRESLPVILLITDAPFHNGPPGVSPRAPYDLRPPPHQYADAVRVLRDLGVLVVGLGANDPGRLSPVPHLREVAADTGAVADGRPLVIDIGSSGTGVDRKVVDAVSRLASDVPLDVFAEVEDVLGDAFDAREQVVAVHALEASPTDGVASIEPDHFRGVMPGTEVTFGLDVTADGIDPGGATLRIPARVVFRAFDRSRLGAQPIEIVIGPGGC